MHYTKKLVFFILLIGILLPSQKSFRGLKKDQILHNIKKHPGEKIKVAITDIDGILRGKVINKKKFLSIIEGGFGFCDVVFGWDSADELYDNGQLTGWHTGFPDANAFPPPHPWP